MAAGGRRGRPGARRKAPPRIGGARIAVLGAGAIGSALAAALAGRDVRLWSHTPARARDVAKRAGVRAEPDLARAVDGADLVLLCVRDAALAGLARALARPRARRRETRRPCVVLHTSGALGARVLAPLARAGFGTGALHPLVPVPRDAPEGVFRGAAFALEAPTPAVRAVGRALAGELGGAAFELGASARVRARYHAAATLVSNGALALFDVALGEVLPRGLRRPEVRRGFGELLRRTAENVARASASAAALTGPVARGDDATVRTHLARLARNPPARELYRRLSVELLRLAAADGRLAPERRAALARALEARGGG
jgi:predicted short-subunit dehydrogenase-like oxidoreductase (DUF2520 family)